MSAQTDTFPQAPAARRPAGKLRLSPYLAEARYELLATMRQPSFFVPTLLFPAMFYLFFGVLFGGQNGMSSYLLATYGAFGVIGTALFGFGVGIAMARESGELRLKEVTPAPPFAVLGAKMVTALAFSAVVLAELFALGALLAGVRFERLEWVGLAAVLLLGTVPFAALGLAIGTHSTGKGAPAVVNLVYLPMAFLSGLWIPVELLPGFLRQLAVALPPYHLAQLALQAIGRGVGQPALLHAGVLLIVTVVSLGVAAHGLRSPGGK